MTSRPRHAVTATTVFDGAAERHDSAVVIKGSRIEWVGPRQRLTDDIPVHALPADAWLAPGFIDVQVNGGGDVLFNAEPSPAALIRIAVAHRQFGTTSLLPTLISDTHEKMQVALHAVQDVTSAEAGILGIHFEGPFLSPDKPGVHDQAMIRAPGGEDLELLRSVRVPSVVTLAPERVPRRFIAELAKAGVRVSLGHAAATYAQTKHALAEGMTGFTHLFNAMRPLASREPGPIAAALESSGAWFGLIMDGIHVHPAMLRLALRGTGNPMLITDAMPPAGGVEANFALCGRTIKVHGQCCRTPDGTLAGTALDMASAVRNCTGLLGVPLSDALRYASLEPARFLGLDDRLGRIAPGLRADLVAFEPGSVHVFGTWIAGRWQPSKHTGGGPAIVST